MHNKTPFHQKIALIILGLFLTVVVLEAGLRLGGFIVLSVQELRNRQSLQQKDTYRILCLGESTTAGQYPSYLEEILNQRNAGIKFSVIDKGVGGTETSIILSKLESNLATYNPGMVIAMIGINDQQIARYNNIPFFHARLFQHLRSYRFLLVLYSRVSEKLKIPARPPQQQNSLAQAEERFKKDIARDPGNAHAYVTLGQAYFQQGNFSRAEDSFKNAIKLDPRNDEAYVELGKLYRDQRRLFQVEESFQKAIALNSQEYRAWMGLGRPYITQHQLSQAEDSFKKAIELNPKNDAAHVGLGWVFWSRRQFSQAEDLFRKAIALNPKNDEAFSGLGRVYRNRGKLSQAEEYLKKAIELNPKNDAAHFGLGQIYQNQGQFSQAEGVFGKAIALNPQNDRVYMWLGSLYQAQGKSSQAADAYKKVIELTPRNVYAYIKLGWFYQTQGKLSQAVDAYKKVIELDPQNDRVYGTLSVLCETIGNSEQAKAYAQKANRIRLEQDNFVTAHNYRALKEILDKRGIRLVYVQYPMRSIEPLKKIFQDDGEGIIFVDNERIFRDAVKKDGYSVYFKDMFGGDFGHCTDKGNRLLAENIANMILKEVFKK
jgi:tetratricopeptide (TPR) repeat protein